MIDLDLLNYFTESQNHRKFMITDVVDLMLEVFDLPSLKSRAYLIYMVYVMASADWSMQGARPSAATFIKVMSYRTR